MNGSPYFYQPNVQRIDNQIKELEQLKNQFQTIPQQPMNVFNVGNGTQIEFEARFIKDDEEVENIPISRKTAFISPKNGYLKVKELNGDITTYELIPPKDDKDRRIEELERKIKEMEAQNELTKSNGSTNEIKRPASNDTKSSKK